MHLNEFSQFISTIKQYPHTLAIQSKFLSNSTNERKNESQRLHYFNPIINPIIITTLFLLLVVIIFFKRLLIFSNK